MRSVQNLNRWTFAGSLGAMSIALSAAAPAGAQLVVFPVQSADSFAYDISPDGQFCAGSTNQRFGYQQAYRWGWDGSAVILGHLPGQGSIQAFGVSNQGQAVVGTNITDGVLIYEAFRWTPTGGMQGLGILPGYTDSEATGVSGDGSVVSGFCSSPSSWTPMRWTESGGMQNLGLLPGTVNGEANAVSADGSTIVGSCFTSTNIQRAFRWREGVGITYLGYNGFVRGVSDDGSVIVGATSSLRPCVWTESGGMMPIPDVGSYGVADGVSGDGSIVVGDGTLNGSSGIPFIWDAAHGTRSFNTYLTSEVGLNMNGFRVIRVTDVSSDGTVFAGYGDLPNNDRVAFMVTVPAPSTILLLVAWPVCARRRRRG